MDMILINFAIGGPVFGVDAFSANRPGTSIMHVIVPDLEGVGAGHRNALLFCEASFCRSFLFEQFQEFAVAFLFKILLFDNILLHQWPGKTRPAGTGRKFVERTE